MPETATRPARTRAARTAPKVAKPATAKPDTESTDVAEDARERIPLKLVKAPDTKRFSKFVVPEDMKEICVGTIYAPLGTVEVKVLLIGAAA